ncbi:hypothetical protein HLB35_03675 [Halomonas sp. TBZ9]|uniref:PilY1 beta-propeller domain-containing protein n=1 Tax=Vreelandella azerica TaxID=2732867 RepID=A0A7Y3TW94_9GAMM|nr:PilC/PilY family type IV pilus protein [Halomonas azerica]NOG31083.1 hypothetical protein [Halomonas azerica]
MEKHCLSWLRIFTCAYWGLNEDGTVNEDHWGRISTKLGKQRHDWPGELGEADNPMTDPSWPIISAGLTPLEGTMYTATDYFLNRTGYFNRNQGNNGFELPNIDNPEASQCLVNANIWLTDGLPSVDRSGRPLGSNVKEAIAQAESSIKRLYCESYKPNPEKSVTNYQQICKDYDQESVYNGNRLNDPVKTYVVGFSLPPDVVNIFGDGENPLNVLAAAGGTDQAYLANDEDSLNEVMQQVFGNIIAGAQYNTSAASNVSELNAATDSFIYTASFDSGDWSGTLEAYRIGTDGSLALEWSAEDSLSSQAENRNLLTSTVIRNEDESLSTTGVMLNESTTQLTVPEVSWLKGQNVEGLRNRQFLLGDIINSNPRVIPATDERSGVVLVGANDGMLHGFDTKTGRELFAYMPAELSFGENPAIRELMQPNYAHRYFVDGETTVKEVTIDGKQRVIAVGTMGAGGRSVFALDITDPGNVGSDDVLWEFRHPELGVGVSSAKITEIDGVPVAVFGNGYNSTGYQASLFIVDLKTGNFLISDSNGHAMPISTGSGSADAPNGLAAPAVLSNSGVAYAGDLKGDMWRFDLKNKSVRKLYSGSPDRPITSAPALTASNIRPNTMMVLFGTGSYFRNSDIGDIATQRLIGLQDGLDDQSTIVDNKLITQSTLLLGTTSDGSFDLRATSNNLLEENKRGWYLPLEGGERVVSTPVISTGGQRVFFSTLIPDESDPCAGDVMATF